MDKEILELARVWMEDEEIQCRLLPDAFETPDAWGHVLAEMAANVAQSLADGDEAERQRLLESLKATFVAELERQAGEH